MRKKGLLMCGYRWILACVLLSLPSCSSSDLPGPSGTVQGVAKYKGGPIPIGSAVVMVHDTAGLLGIGTTNELGKFTITMNGRRQVLVGDYSVYVKPPGDPDENVLVYTEKTVPPEWNKIPKSYWSASTSKARFEVKEGSNDFEFTLVD